MTTKSMLMRITFTSLLIAVVLGAPLAALMAWGGTTMEMTHEMPSMWSEAEASVQPMEGGRGQDVLVVPGDATAAFEGDTEAPEHNSRGQE